MNKFLIKKYYYYEIHKIYLQANYSRLKKYQKNKILMDCLMFLDNYSYTNNLRLLNISIKFKKVLKDKNINRKIRLCLKKI